MFHLFVTTRVVHTHVCISNVVIRVHVIIYLDHVMITRNMDVRELLAARLAQLSREVLSCSDEEKVQLVATRIEAVFLDVVELDSRQVTEIHPSVFEELRESLVLLKQASPSVSLPRGRPRFDVSQDQIKYLMELGLTTVMISNVLGLSRSTLARRMREFGLRASEKYCSISDEELDALVSSLSQQFPGCGHKMMQGHLRSRGVVVQQARARESLRRTDPEGVLLRQRLSIHRRQYNVSTPLELWHIDGNHKLIRFVLLFIEM